MTAVTSPSQYESIIDDGEPKVIYFGSTRCPACHMADPVINRLRERHPELRFYRVEYTDKALRPIFVDEEIRSLPSFIVIDGRRRTRFTQGRLDDLEDYLDDRMKNEDF